MEKIIYFVIAVILSGCTTGMSYHSWDSALELGYTDMQLNEKVFRVSYAGYNIPQSECDDFAIMRAAEIAKEKGYKYFRILAENKSVQSQAYFIPGATYTTGTVTGNGNTASFNATSYSGGVAGTIQRPTSTFTIELLKEKDEVPVTIDAEIAWNSLAKKHGVVK